MGVADWPSCLCDRYKDPHIRSTDRLVQIHSTTNDSLVKKRIMEESKWTELGIICRRDCEQCLAFFVAKKFVAIVFSDRNNFVPLTSSFPGNGIAPTRSSFRLFGFKHRWWFLLMKTSKKKVTKMINIFWIDRCNKSHMLHHIKHAWVTTDIGQCIICDCITIDYTYINVSSSIIFGIHLIKCL